LFEKKVEAGRLTFDDKGKVLNVRQVKTEKLPAEFKDLMGHNYHNGSNHASKQDLKNKKRSKNQKESNDHTNKPSGTVLHLTTSFQPLLTIQHRRVFDLKIQRYHSCPKAQRYHCRQRSDQGININSTIEWSGIPARC